MKLLPELFNDRFNEIFRDPFFSTSTKDYMKTDVKETKEGYLLDMELPGYKKEDIQLALTDGTLTINATRKSSSEEKDKDGNILRQERYSGSCTRSFYVGEGISQDQIKASYDNGELKVNIPKSAPVVEEQKFIPIE